jgi:uncharacterized protein YacL (UPF0231 family)
MEYEFHYNSANQAQAEFSMGHEAVGRWFSDELGENLVKIDQLLAIIDDIEHGRLAQKTLYGVELSLSLNPDEVEVNALFDSDEELPEDTYLSENHSHAGCGLLDFKQALVDWQSFLK